jgi:Calcium-activated chloride channel
MIEAPSARQAQQLRRCTIDASSDDPSSTLASRVVLLISDSDAGQRLVPAQLADKLSAHGLRATIKQQSGRTCLLVQAPFKSLVQEAERQHLQRCNGLQCSPITAATVNLSSSESCYLLQSLIDAVPLDTALLKGQQHEHTARTVSSLIQALQLCGAIEHKAPLHNPSHMPHLATDVYSIEAYFGSEIAFYFAWLYSYTIWLAIPAVAGFVLAVHGHYSRHTTDNNPYIPIYALLVILWAAAFRQHWLQKTAELSWQWNTLLDKEIGVVTLRPEFQGEIRVSAVTGRQERYFPASKRLPHYALSTVVTLVMLCIALAVMVASLNLQGYMDNDTALERLLYIDRLAVLAEKGSVFDPRGTFFVVLPRSLGPTLLHVIVINLLNTAYRRVATALTRFENHATQQRHNNALMIKVS